jgi:hypothetical protein
MARAQSLLYPFRSRNTDGRVHDYSVDAEPRMNGGDAVLVDVGTRAGRRMLHKELLETNNTPAQISAMPSTFARLKASPSHIAETAATTT